MSSTNLVRTRRKAAHRREYHTNQIRQAQTPRRELQAAVQWLISEAFQADRCTELAQVVRQLAADVAAQFLEAHRDSE